ncbi:MAG: xylose isomerase, partial [Prosthecobacter sp.]|nr:xylose isomerase [Prosthecobacter sp.]
INLLGQVTVDNAVEWVAASKEIVLIIDVTVGGLSDGIEAGIDLTKKLGGDSMLVVLAYPQDVPLQQTWDTSVARMKEAAKHAEKQGIRVLIENVWNTFLISAYDMARFIDEVGSPWVQVHFDIGNMMRWGVAEHWAQVLGKRSLKLDVKEYDLDRAMNEGMRKGYDKPIGEGSINWAAVRAELVKIDFRGWAAAEVKAGDWEYLADVAKRMDKVLDL